MNHEYIKQFNLIDQYVLGKLAADEAEAFEDHFIDCPECVEQLNVTRSFIHDLKGLAVKETLVSGNKPAPVTQWFIPIRPWAVVACCCVLVAAVLAFFAVRRAGQLENEVRRAKEEASASNQQYQRRLETAAQSEKQHQETQQQLTQRISELEQKLKTEVEASKQNPARGSDAPEINFPIYALVSVPRGQVPGRVEIVPPASSSRFALSIPVEDRRNFSVYRVTIVDQRGTTVWKQSGFKPDAYHALSLSLKSNFLSSGTYDLRVEGLTPPNMWDTVGSYPFRFTRR
jgi:hypothetical protein